VRLTVEDNPETMKRYAHLAPARGWGTRRCGASFPGRDRRCGRERGHRGPHVAHGFLGRVVAVWEGAPSDPSAEQPRRRKPVKGGPIGLRVRRPEGLIAALGKRMRSVVSSPDELIWLVLFVGFVAFGIHVLATIFL